MARVEQLTFICTPTKEEAGPTNNWMPPSEAYAKLRGLFEGAMRGRTMYVVPYVMGPIGSPFSKIGIELTDSVYVVLNMGIMTRMGNVALQVLGQGHDFNRGLHSTLDCNPDRRFICHFPEDNTIWSVGSGYGGNVLFGKKCLSLRMGSFLGKKEGWLAEHMLIMGVESRKVKLRMSRRRFRVPAARRTSPMLVPPESFGGWRIWTLGDDIAWMRPGSDGRLYAVNPEAGYFGVAPGNEREDQSQCDEDRGSRHDLRANVGLTKEGDVWWEGMDGEVPAELTDWTGRSWQRGSVTPCCSSELPVHGSCHEQSRAKFAR